MSESTEITVGDTQIVLASRPTAEGVKGLTDDDLHKLGKGAVRLTAEILTVICTEFKSRFDAARESKRDGKKPAGLYHNFSDFDKASRHFLNLSGQSVRNYVHGHATPPKKIPAKVQPPKIKTAADLKLDKVNEKVAAMKTKTEDAVKGRRTYEDGAAAIKECQAALAPLAPHKGCVDAVTPQPKPHAVVIKTRDYEELLPLVKNLIWSSGERETKAARKAVVDFLKARGEFEMPPPPAKKTKSRDEVRKECEDKLKNEPSQSTSKPLPFDVNDPSLVHGTTFSQNAKGAGAEIILGSKKEIDSLKRAHGLAL